VNVRQQQVSEGVIYEAVLGESAKALETGGGDSNVKMPPSIASASVTGVEVALVSDFQYPRMERRRQAFPDRRRPLGGGMTSQGKTCTNGFTLISIQAPAAT